MKYVSYMAPRIAAMVFLGLTWVNSYSAVFQPLAESTAAEIGIYWTGIGGFEGGGASSKRESFRSPENQLGTEKTLEVSGLTLNSPDGPFFSNSTARLQTSLRPDIFWARSTLNAPSAPTIYKSGGYANTSLRIDFVVVSAQEYLLSFDNQLGTEEALIDFSLNQGSNVIFAYSCLSDEVPCFNNKFSERLLLTEGIYSVSSTAGVVGDFGSSGQSYFEIAPVPELGSLSMLVFGLAAITFRFQKRMQVFPK
jgi:hypothetical protein